MINRKLPDTITTWTGSAVCTNAVKGVGVSETVNITAFQPFFVEPVLPYSVKNGEILPLKVSVFNFAKDKLPVSIFTYLQLLKIQG